MEISKTSTGQQSNAPTSYVAATPANHSAKQESDKENTTRDTCGPGSETPLATYDLNTQSWKMYGAMSLWGDSPLLESLPASGTTQSGELFRRPQWEQITDANGSLLWPTPTAVTRAMEGNVRIYRQKIRQGEMSEAEAEAILGKSVWAAQGKIPAEWPTPTHGKLAGGQGAYNKIQSLFTEGKISEEERRAMVAGNGGKLNPMWVEWLMGFPLGWTDLED